MTIIDSAEFFKIAERTEETRQDLTVRVYFLTEDDLQFACFFVNLLDQTKDYEYAYEMTDPTDWVQTDLLERIAKDFA